MNNLVDTLDDLRVMCMFHDDQAYLHVSAGTDYVKPRVDLGLTRAAAQYLEDELGGPFDTRQVDPLHFLLVSASSDKGPNVQEWQPEHRPHTNVGGHDKRLQFSGKRARRLQLRNTNSPAELYHLRMPYFNCVLVRATRLPASPGFRR